MLCAKRLNVVNFSLSVSDEPDDKEKEFIVRNEVERTVQITIWEETLRQVSLRAVA